MQIDAAPEENDNSVEEPVAEVLTACIDLDTYIASYKGEQIGGYASSPSLSEPCVASYKVNKLCKI